MAAQSLKEVEQILKNLGRTADQRGFDALTREEKNVLLPWSARGVIGNGGFKYFYQGTMDPIATARAFRLLGWEEVACACEESLAVFPGRRWPGPADSWKHLDGVDWERFRDIDRKVCGLTFDNLLSSIATYISRRPGAFRSPQALS